MSSAFLQTLQVSAMVLRSQNPRRDSSNDLDLMAQY